MKTIEIVFPLFKTSKTMAGNESTFLFVYTYSQILYVVWKIVTFMLVSIFWARRQIMSHLHLCCEERLVLLENRWTAINILRVSLLAFHPLGFVSTLNLPFSDDYMEMSQKMQNHSIKSERLCIIYLSMYQSNECLRLVAHFIFTCFAFICKSVHGGTWNWPWTLRSLVSTRTRTGTSHQQ